MALESIGAAGNGVNYAEVVKQSVNVGRASQIQNNAPEEEGMTPATANLAATVSVEAKGAEALGKREEEQTISSKIKDAVDKVNQKIVPTKTRCEFSYHEETKRISIKVIDQRTEETIREIPPEETLDMLSKIWELAGLMVDEKR